MNLKEQILTIRPFSLWAGLLGPLIAATEVSQNMITNSNKQVILTVLCVCVSVFLQIGCNYANDYCDTKKGVDSAKTHLNTRTRPELSLSQNLTRFIIFTVLACLNGLAIVILLSVSILVKAALILVGLFCILGSWGYSGGKSPYASKGLGELSSGFFFGPVAILGTYFVLNSETLNTDYLALFSSSQFSSHTINTLIHCLSFGLIVACMMSVDNIRDIESDEIGGKITLQVKLGLKKSVKLYYFMSTLALILSFNIVGIIFGIFFIVAQTKNLKTLNYKSAFIAHSMLGIIVGVSNMLILQL